MKKRILCFGDSLTWGFDPVNRVRFPEESRWPMVMQQILGDEYVVIEEAQSGRTIATEDPGEGEKNGLTYILPCLESHTPLDLVIILLGSNDVKRKFSYCSMDIAGEMQIFLEKVLSYNHFRCNDQFKVLLISPPYITDEINESWLGDQFGYENGSRLIKELADWYKQLAEMYHIDFLDAAQYVTASPADACHLDEENQRKLGSVIADYVKTALAD